MIKEIDNKTVIRKCEAGFTPYTYDINIYRGCAHRCRYCYALYSHKYLESDNFYDDIFFKKNIDLLDKELCSNKNKGELVGVGTVCGSYQPLERSLKIMPKVLSYFIKHKTPIYLSTKSNLILRDIELIKQLSSVTQVYISLSITCMDEKISSKLEPNVISSEERFMVAKKLKEETNAFVGVHLMPIIPYLTDSKENLTAIISRAKELNLDFVKAAPLNLFGETKKAFYNFLDREFPRQSKEIQSLYSSSKSVKDNYIRVTDFVNKIKAEVGFHNKCTCYEWKKESPKQISLFD